MIEHFLTYLSIERRYSPATVEAYRRDLEDFCDFLGWQVGEYDPTRVSDDDVKAWMVEMMDERKQTPRTVKRRLSCLKSFYKFLLRTDRVKVDITRAIVAPKTDKPLPVFFKPHEMERALAYEQSADDFDSIRDCLIIELFYQTGMRQAELLGLKDGDFDLNTGQVRIFGKRRKERIVPLGDKIIEQIKNYLKARAEFGEVGTFFVRKTRKGIGPLERRWLYQMVADRMGEVSTLKKHSPHVLRHTFATELLSNGADIRTIQQLLGHSSLAATEVYTHTTFEQIKKTYLASHPRAKQDKQPK